MSTGQVKWFNNAKGFGFILPEDGGAELFAHYSSIIMEGYKTLKAGQLVSFDTEEGPKGMHATNIKLLTGQMAATRETTEVQSGG
ncbi:MAG: cold shock domain-containing protein [Gammaproteobacteria bacterium]|nr:cold shock domain-containing protein [Gammaproteobacteria bacterium]